jgi:hypothetical protein
MFQSLWRLLGAAMKIVKLIGPGVVALVLFCGVASADLLYLDSQAGLLTSNGTDTVAITPHSLWQPNNPVNPGDPSDDSAVWISFADTGYGGSYFQAFSGTTPVVSIFQSFQSDPGTLTLNVWADDTADVLLDGNYLMHAVFTQDICSGQAIGCRPQDVGAFSAPLSAGSHTLEFVLYQVGTGESTTSNPFGLLYTGTAPKDPLPIPSVPEPSSWLLLGTTIFLVGMIMKYRSYSTPS